MGLQLRPAGEPVLPRDRQLCVGEYEPGDRCRRARMEFARPSDGGGVAGADALRQALGFFSEMLEGRIVRQRTRRHSDLLARASGLAACGPQHQARKCLPVGVDETGGLGPFRGLGASRTLASMLADSPPEPACRILTSFQRGQQSPAVWIDSFDRFCNMTL